MYRDKAWMEQMLAIPGTTIKTMAEAAGCDPKTITRWLKRHGLKTRPMTESAWLRQAKHTEISAQALTILEGELMGDGNLQARSERSARYQHNSKHYEYLVWLSGLLEEGGLTGSVIKGLLWFYHTHSYTALRPVYDRWYQNGVKVVPQDLKLTPQMALHWYLGDGYLIIDKRCNNPITGVRLSTDCFTLAEVAFLAEQLAQFKPYINRYQKTHEERGYRLILHKSFLEWIGPCPQPIEAIYGYKWTGKSQQT